MRTVCTNGGGCVFVYGVAPVDIVCTEKYTVELHWLEHLWEYENEFETRVVRTNEG